MKVCVLYTGGKDSHYALLKVLEAGHEVVCLATAAPIREDSYMFHSVNVRWSLLHGEAMGLPHYLLKVSGEKEVEVEELYRELRLLVTLHGVEGIVSGAVSSLYQKRRIDNVAKALGISHITPLWGRDHVELLREEVAKIRFVITATMALGLSERHLCAVVDENMAEEIIALARRYGFSPVGEGGEYESYVVESPLFAIDIVAEPRWRPSGWGVCEIKEAKIRRGLRAGSSFPGITRGNPMSAPS
ncbi:MAG: diphthine--ammonia ligase [Pyrobaculum sp.]|uniref:diphthine--ammonia ligase n=1 Tax=Pyrobaculum sp. TaxID=2004705 RepID=UPI00316D8A42